MLSRDWESFLEPSLWMLSLRNMHALIRRSVWRGSPAYILIWAHCRQIRFVFKSQVTHNRQPKSQRGCSWKPPRWRPYNRDPVNLKIYPMLPCALSHGSDSVSFNKTAISESDDKIASLKAILITAHLRFFSWWTLIWSTTTRLIFPQICTAMAQSQ